MNLGSISGLWKVPLVLAVSVLFTGCGAPTPHPPAFSLYGYQRVAIVPFENDSPDADLSAAVEDQLAGSMANLRAVPVIEAAQVASYLNGLGVQAPSLPLEAGLRAKIANQFKSDLLLTGVVTSYVETMKDGDPERRVVDSTTGEAQWGFNRFRRVDVAIIVKLIDPKTGSLLWTEQTTGWSYTNKFNPLPIPGSVRIPPIQGLDELLHAGKMAVELVRERDERNKPVVSGPKPLLYKDSRAFTEQRQESIANAVNYVVADFQGSNGWTPNLK